VIPEEILQKATKWSEKLSDLVKYTDRPWLEVSFGSPQSPTILHLFNEDGAYLRSVNGDYIAGKWRILEATNKLVVDKGEDRGHIFDLLFLSSDFLILQKHGQKEEDFEEKYLFLIYEPLGKNLDREACWELFAQNNQYNNNVILWLFLFLVLVVGTIIYFLSGS
jgi:hypothetical protein